MEHKFKIAYLHMGSDKTGSTSLQSFMHNNREKNQSNYGVFYAPEVWQARFASYFSGSDKSFIHNVHSGLSDEKEIASLDSNYMAHLESQLTSVKKPYKLVLSYEGFHCLTLDSLLKMKEYLLQYAEEVKVIYYVRPACSYAISGISEHVRAGLLVKANPPFQPYKNYLSKFQKVFSKKELIISKFARDELYGNDILADFMHKIDKDIDITDYSVDEGSDNKSLSGLACYVGMNVISRYFSLSEKKDESTFGLGRKILPFLVDIEGDGLKLTPKQLSSVLINSEENSKYIESEFGIDLSENIEKYVYSADDMVVINSSSFKERIDDIAISILNSFTEAGSDIQKKTRLDIDNVVFEDIKDHLDVDFLRDEAINLEPFDVKKSLKLMELAYRARPDGVFIEKKVMHYREKLAETRGRN